MGSCHSFILVACPGETVPQGACAPEGFCSVLLLVNILVPPRLQPPTNPAVLDVLAGLWGRCTCASTDLTAGGGRAVSWDFMQVQLSRESWCFQVFASI